MPSGIEPATFQLAAQCLIYYLFILLFSSSAVVRRQPQQLSTPNSRGPLGACLLCLLGNPVLLKADSHIACRAHAVPMPFPCHAVPLIHTCHVAPLPCSDSAVSFVKVRVVAGNIRTAGPTV